MKQPHGVNMGLTKAVASSAEEKCFFVPSFLVICEGIQSQIWANTLILRWDRSSSGRVCSTWVPNISIRTSAKKVDLLWTRAQNVGLILHLLGGGGQSVQTDQ